MCPESLEKAFKKYPQAKVVMLAHLYGTPSKMDEIMEICRRHDAVLIEDAAEALSSTYKGQKCGTFGKYSALSFNGNKLLRRPAEACLLQRIRLLAIRLFFGPLRREKKLIGISMRR